MLTFSRKQSGFSLIELSLVIAVIGLIAGGVMVAQNLSRSSELLSVLAEYGKIKQSVDRFQTKYNYLPGDMPTAESQWGSDAGCPATAFNTVPKRVTCNGNGDGQIGDFQTGTNAYEWFRAWQHLANSGLFDGYGIGTSSFTGVLGAAGNSAKALAGVNVPASKMTGGGWMLMYLGTYSGNAMFYDGAYGHALLFGFDGPGGAYLANNPTYYPIMTPEEAWNLDLKIDDGRPAYGKVLSYKQTNTVSTNCTTSDAASTAAYSVTTPYTPCALVFLMDF